MRHWWRALGSWMAAGRTRWYVSVGLCVVIVGAALTWWLTRSATDDVPRERRYHDVTACLLTDASGVSGVESAQVWAGMQDASLKALAKVQFLAVPGRQDASNAAIYLSGLAQGGCAMVIAVGEGPVGAVTATAARYGEVRFVSVTATATATAQPAAGNVSLLDASSDDLRAKVTEVVISTLATKLLD